MNFDLSELIGSVPKPDPEIPDLDELTKNAKFSAGADARFKAMANREMLKGIMGPDFDTVKAHPSDVTSGVYDIPSAVIDALDNRRYEDDSQAKCPCNCKLCLENKCGSCSAAEKCANCVAARYASAPAKARKITRKAGGELHEIPGYTKWDLVGRFQ
jgi:hypothetical protein